MSSSPDWNALQEISRGFGVGRLLERDQLPASLAGGAQRPGVAVVAGVADLLRPDLLECCAQPAAGVLVCSAGSRAEGHQVSLCGFGALLAGADLRERAFGQDEPSGGNVVVVGIVVN